MLLSLLKVVCIAVMGVGVHNTPTPIYIKEDTKPQNQINLNENEIKINPQKAEGDESEVDYNQDLDFNPGGTNSKSDTNLTYEYLSNKNWAMFQTGMNDPYYKRTGARKTGSNNTSPYNISYANIENKLNWIGNGDTETNTLNQYSGLSWGTFMEDKWNNVTAVKIDTNKPTKESQLKLYREYHFRYQKTSYGTQTGKTFNTTIYNETYIGFGNEAETVFNRIQSGSIVNAVDARKADLDAQIANYQIIRNQNTVQTTIGDNNTLTGYVVENTYTPNILATTATYIFEFTKIKIDYVEDITTDDYMYLTNANESSFEDVPLLQSTRYTNNNQLYGHISGQEEDVNTLVTTWSNAQIVVEVVDIPGLIFQVITMPFTFISTAFNLTIFPGTPYQVNISNLMLTIFGILVFIYILKLIAKK